MYVISLQAYEKQKAADDKREWSRQEMPVSLKKTKEWLIDLARNFGFLDDRQVHLIGGIHQNNRASTAELNFLLIAIEI